MATTPTASPGDRLGLRVSPTGNRHAQSRDAKTYFAITPATGGRMLPHDPWAPGANAPGAPAIGLGVHGEIVDQSRGQQQFSNS